jgi:hypothetical protein
LPLNMRWFLTFSNVPKIRPLHLAQGQCNFLNAYNLPRCFSRI